MPEKLKVFLCHASENKTIVKELFNNLKSDGFETWLDSDQILPGMDWDLEIQKAMRASDAVIVCFSKISVQKEGYVQKEIKLGIEIQKEKPEGTIFLIPLQLEECSIPYSLRNVEWGKYFEPDGYEKLVKALTQRANQLQRKITEQSSLKSKFANQSFQLEPWLYPLSVQKLDGPPSELGNKSLLRVLNEHSKVILVGNSGSGKTVALKMACNELNQSTEHSCCFIPLKNYSKNLGYTIKELLNWHNIQDGQVLSVLEQQNIILLLDGLNEVTFKDQEDCLKEIDVLLNTYKGQVCITYTISDMTYFGFEYPVYAMSLLGKSEIEKTIREFFKAKETPQKADWFLQSIRGYDLERQQNFEKLANLPINLHFLLELAQDKIFTYSSLGDLYGQVIQKRLERTKMHNQRNKLSADLKTDCLIGLAYRSILDDHQLQIQKEFVRETFVNVTNITKTDADLALSEIIRAGLLLEVNDFLVEWPHPSFRDYLAGRGLFNLVETHRSFEEFPLDKPNGFAAAAHATRLLTTQSRNLNNRSSIFLSVLNTVPSIETMKALAEEYHSALAYYSSTGQHIKCDKIIFSKINWGERFLKAYNLIRDIARKNNLPGVDEIPSPQGLKVFFDTNSVFCLITFSGESGIQFDELEAFNGQISHRARRKIPRMGFCLYAPFLLLLDPEIIAYFEVGVWLRTRAESTEGYLRDWHKDLAVFISPENGLVYWQQDQEIPTPDFEILAGPEETMEFLYKVFGAEQVQQMTRSTDILVHSRTEILQWHEIYMPITFQIDPYKTKGFQQAISNRLSQIMVQTRPDHRISLWFFAPFISASDKVDQGINIFVPFPIPLLNRFYYLYGEQWTIGTDNWEFFLHLRG